MKVTKLVSILLLGLTAMWLKAQTPAPIIVPVATPRPAAPAAVTPATNVADQAGAIQLLHEMEAANSEMLKRQEATLAVLDDLQKAAEELKIFSKRG